MKSAASYTLGNIAIGNLPEYLPFILQEIEAQPKRQYLLLHSLKEVKIKLLCTLHLCKTKCKIIPKNTLFSFADYHMSVGQSVWCVAFAEFRTFDLDAFIQALRMHGGRYSECRGRMPRQVNID